LRGKIQTVTWELESSKEELKPRFLEKTDKKAWRRKLQERNSRPRSSKAHYTDL